MIARLARRLSARDDAGLGLIEILVASAIGLLLMTAVGATFIQTTKVTTLTIQGRSSTGGASNAMQEISEVIHLATPIAIPITGPNAPSTTPAIFSATAQTLVIYSFVDVTSTTNPAPSRVSLDTTSGSLVDTRCVGTPSSGFWTFGTCSATSTRTVAGTFVAPGAGQNALFTYLDANGNVLPLTGGTLPSASIPLVGSIIVSVNLLAPGAKNSPVYLQSKTGMPNVGIQTEVS